MVYKNVRCEVVKVNTETGVCPGVAETRQGEVFIIGPRTPDAKGMCCQALIAASSMKHVFAITEKMEWEKNDYFDIICPHGAVTYRLSRIKEL